MFLFKLESLILLLSLKGGDDESHCMEVADEVDEVDICLVTFEISSKFAGFALDWACDKEIALALPGCEENFIGAGVV